MVNYVADIPTHGVGLGFRMELNESIFAAREEINFLEIITDQYILDTRDKGLERLCEAFPVIPHGVGLSIGSMTPIDKHYLSAVKRISDITRSAYYSEHLCMTNAPGIDIGHLSPLWFTEEVLQRTIERVTYVQEYLGKPLILENVTYLFTLPQAKLSQTEFFHRLVEATGCGILLDLTNIFINSVNHHFDAAAFLAQMPLDHVVQVHLAGGYWDRNILVDGHSELVQEESWELLRLLASQCQVKGVIFEHDANYPAMKLLLHQISRARRIVNGEMSNEVAPDPSLSS